ncbi:MAG: FAD-binding monooxygenase [Bowdeniella nasicola]|nr:FAD-binding monooxygenase [Bowdeniella nasicola]
MQFHHYGYVSGDPRVQPASGVGLERSPDLPDTMDVLIVGAGPAGMMTAAQLAQFPNVRAHIVERRPGRLELGQADGIQARSVETFQAFGFADRITNEAYRITEMCFWKPDPNNPEHIVRTARTPDDEHGISEFPHLIVNQARVLDYFAEYAANAPARMRPNWGWEYVDLRIEEGADYPVVVTLKRTADPDQGQVREVRAKYVLGADGARSGVRDAIGARHVGGVSYHAWGVMDVLAVTDFPDIRLKCAIQSTAGSILHIPREGGHLFRMYVDLGEVPEDDDHRVRETPLEAIIDKANAIMRPYHVDVRNVAWWSVYEVGHRVTDRFDDVPEEEVGKRHPHVFIAGDACHTHSAKAGQGMNVSMQDGFNLAWKLRQVIEGLSPASLLGTYTGERRQIAQDLIDFDREWSSMMAAKPEELPSPSALEEYYVRTHEFPAGFMTQYPPSLIIDTADHQHLAEGFPVGKRFKSHPVVRVCDGNPVHLGHLHQADGRWRIYCFGDGGAPGSDSALDRLATFLAENPASPVRAHTPKGADLDSLFDVKAIYRQPYDEVDLTRVPVAFRTPHGPFQLVNPDQVFAADANNSIYAARGLSADGVIVVVRPDQYVAAVLPLDGTERLADFFRPIFTP